MRVFYRVVDPCSFFPDPDPDPEFDVGDQYGSRALMTKKWKKTTALIKNCNLPIPRPP
jgi:hypothetical protein